MYSLTSALLFYGGGRGLVTTAATVRCPPLQGGPGATLSHARRLPEVRAGQLAVLHALL